jgi:hypothetical protein
MFCVAAVATLSCLTVVSCGNQNLWNRISGKPRIAKRCRPHRTPSHRLLAGSDSDGEVRARIEPERITLALKCDKAGKSYHKAPRRSCSAGQAHAHDARGRPLQRQGREVRLPLLKGNEFRYRLRENGILELDFAGSALAEFKKLSD